MMRDSLILFLIFNASILVAQKDADIYLFDINLGNAPEISDPVNITNRPGNDGDPIFHPNNKSLIYSRQSYSGDADIYRYDIKKKQHHQLTFTIERESTPRLSFDSKDLTVIVEDQVGDKHLSSMPLDGGSPQSILDIEDPISDFTWCGEYLLAAYSAEAQVLHLANTLTNGSETTVSGKFGSTFQYIPFDNSLYYVDVSFANGLLKKMTLDDYQSKTVTPVIGEADLFIITSEGAILLGDGHSLYYLEPSDRNWSFVANLNEYGIERFNRMALDNAERKLALVAVIDEGE
ncbi:MAG: hypothetical protein RJQ09_11310 [Cyclobacteriaceae bacterium]